MANKTNKYISIIKNGLIDNNPTFVQLLGMCPTLAVTTSATNAIGMGFAATAVLICSNLFISLLRKLIPNEVRIAAYVVIISGFVSAVELLIKAFLPDIDRALGLFIPLIVVNCIILARAEAFASKNNPIASALDGLSMGLGFTFALLIVGSIREILGAGAIFGVNILGQSYKPALMFILPAGAFLTLGCVVAAVNFIKEKASRPALAVGDEIIPDEEVTEEVTEDEIAPENSAPVLEDEAEAEAEEVAAAAEAPDEVALPESPALPESEAFPEAEEAEPIPEAEETPNEVAPASYEVEALELDDFDIKKEKTSKSAPANSVEALELDIKEDTDNA